MLDTLSTYDNLDKCIKAICDFEIQTGSTVWLDDEYGNTLYPSNVTTEQDMVAAESYVTFDGSNTPDENVVSTEKDTKAYQFSLKNGTSYTLVVITDLYVVRQSTEVLLSTFPYVIVMVFILSILCALFYSRFITRPVLKLSATSKQMASLDFSGRCDETRSDELGCLAHNLNYLSESLSRSMDELREANAQLRSDMEKEREMERQRVDFFGAASHELKTPLTILKGHLTSIYAHILDEDRKVNAQKFETAFYAKPDLRNVRPPEEPAKSEPATLDLESLVEQLQKSPELASALAALIAAQATAKRSEKSN